MTGNIVSLPPAIQPPVSGASGNPEVLGPLSYVPAIPTLAQIWTGVQTFEPSTFLLAGSTSGTLAVNAAAQASGTLTLPAGTTDFSSTGGTSEVVMQTTSGGPFTVRQLVLADLGGITIQYITSGATVTVAATDGLIVINKGTGSPTTVNLPLSASKVGAVKIVDFKGDSGTNNITVNCAGSDVFNGNTATWTIAGSGASVVCSPIVNSGTGIGYAV